MPRTLAAHDPLQREQAVAAAIRAMRNGRLVVLPAESGYVVATDAFSSTGVAALRRCKGLAPGTSMGIMVGHASGIHGIAAAVPGPATTLMAACWPGQLGLLLRAQPSLQWTVPTDRFVARMPLHPLLLEVVAAVGPTVYSACNDDDRAGVDLVLDCGERPPGPGSSIVDATVEPLQLLRVGAEPVERIQAVVPDLVIGQ
jgi:tRNA threonylcarbamoyl adenosine modification protein (Sua5/YciO/YrdC/YwlC family)